jgi:hypothetical protein
MALAVGQAKTCKKGIGFVFLWREHIGIVVLCCCGWLGYFGGSGVPSFLVEMALCRGH